MLEWGAWICFLPALSNMAATSPMWLFEFINIESNQNFLSLALLATLQVVICYMCLGATIWGSTDVEHHRTFYWTTLLWSVGSHWSSLLQEQDEKNGQWCCVNILSDPCPWALEDMYVSHKKTVKIGVSFERDISEFSDGWNLSCHGNSGYGVKTSLSVGSILAVSPRGMGPPKWRKHSPGKLETLDF